MRMIYAITLLAIISVASTASWQGSVSNVTDGSTWSIYRESATIVFDFSESVNGDIAPINVTARGRMLSPYHAHYLDLDVNDVRLKERTAAQEGNYSSEEIINLRAEVDDVNLTKVKNRDSKTWTFEWVENWPVTIDAKREIDYYGLGISDREFAGNNQDYVGSIYLYNQDFSKERLTNLKLERMNTTVTATNDTIISTDFMPTRSIDYHVQSQSTGIADLEYLQTYPDGTVPNYGQERYYGNYDINRKVQMNSVYFELEDETDWMTCCIGGCYDIDSIDTGLWNEEKVFSCICN